MRGLVRALGQERTCPRGGAHAARPQHTPSTAASCLLPQSANKFAHSKAQSAKPVRRIAFAAASVMQQAVTQATFQLQMLQHTAPLELSLPTGDVTVHEAF